MTEWNEPASKIFGIHRGEALRRRLDGLGIPWHASRLEEAIRNCVNSQRVVRVDDVSFTRGKGKEALFGLSLSPIAEGRGILILGAEITGRRLLERQLAQAQKLESIGQLAASIAQELNTPIQYVGDNTRFLRDAFQNLLRVLDKSVALLLALEKRELNQAKLDGLRKAAERADLDYLKGCTPWPGPWP